MDVAGLVEQGLRRVHAVLGSQLLLGDVAHAHLALDDGVVELGLVGLGVLVEALVLGPALLGLLAGGLVVALGNVERLLLGEQVRLRAVDGALRLVPRRLDLAPCRGEVDLLVGDGLLDLLDGGGVGLGRRGERGELLVEAGKAGVGVVDVTAGARDLRVAQRVGLGQGGLGVLHRALDLLEGARGVLGAALGGLHEVLVGAQPCLVVDLELGKLVREAGVLGVEGVDALLRVIELGVRACEGLALLGHDGVVVALDVGAVVELGLHLLDGDLERLEPRAGCVVLALRPAHVAHGRDALDEGAGGVGGTGREGACRLAKAALCRRGGLLVDPVHRRRVLGAEGLVGERLVKVIKRGEVVVHVIGVGHGVSLLAGEPTTCASFQYSLTLTPTE